MMPGLPVTGLWLEVAAQIARSGPGAFPERQRPEEVAPSSIHHRNAGLMQPLVSILTPSFNQARWLPDNLRSVAAQSYPTIEHVVMDGGSTDGSLEILESTAARVSWKQGPDDGQSDAINKAFRRSSGEIIGWLNSDDAYFSRDAVANAVEIFEKHSDVGVVHGHAVLVNSSGTLLYVLWTPPFARTVLRAHNFIYQPAVFVRRSVIDREYFVDPELDYMMDRELWLYLSSRTKFRRMNRIAAVDRHHPRRKSYTRLDLAANDLAVLRQRYRFMGAGHNKTLRKVFTVGVRVSGLLRVHEASRGSNVLALDTPPISTIASRQIAQLRRWMPSE